ncbi:MAG: TIGR01906 family membrane protein [Lachnospiraceae bacterium]|nr:TIGR01906 family membrane protein [Lachnospiraceae bacterium]
MQKDNRSKTIWGGILGVIFAISLIVVIFFTAMDITIYGNMPESFVQECEKYDVLDDVGISREDMSEVTVEMFEYLRDNRDSLEDVTATINGQPDTPFFNEKECLHMADCKGLFLKGYGLRTACIVICIVILLILFIMFRKDLQGMWHCLAAGTFRGTIGFIVLLAAFAGLAYCYFDRMFIMFHKIFFDNDMWILDPTKDRLLMVMPTGYFIGCVKSIGLYFGIGLVILLVASSLRLSYEKKIKDR